MDLNVKAQKMFKRKIKEKCVYSALGDEIFNIIPKVQPIFKNSN